MTEWDRWERLGIGSATGVTDKHGLGLTPMPGPDEAMITILAEDGARASAIIPKAVLTEDGIMPSVLAALDATQTENRATRAEYSAKLAERLRQEGAG